LRECLLPDFYDRIAQHIIEIPPLRETLKDREEDWKNIWKQLKFRNEAPQEFELLKWLKEQPLYGNYRDLQKIAIYYNAFNQFDNETKSMLKEKTPFQYAKNEFEKYHSQEIQADNSDICFRINPKKTSDEIVADFRYYLQDWAIKEYGSRKIVAEKLSVTEKTLNNWKNRKG
jgi:transcriptional regulator with AAA-type ATPase domain